MYNEVRFIKGAIAVDQRGQLLFCNDFDMTPVRRFYLVSNHKAKFIRAWHAHKKEMKFATVITGKALVAAVKIDNWRCPDKKAKVYCHTLSEKNPGILVIPPGYANGIKTLSSGTQIVFFSNMTLEQSKDDDYRYEPYYWNPWESAQS